MIRFGQESAEDKEDHSRYFKQKGICQGSYKIIGRAEEEARDCAFENDSQNNTLNTGHQDICCLCNSQNAGKSGSHLCNW